MRTTLKIIDYVIVAFKMFALTIVIYNYQSALNEIAREESLHYMIPFIFYSFIGLIRILNYKKLSLPLVSVEIVGGIYFILTVGKIHAFYLVLTIISLLIILRLFYHVSIVKK